MSTSNEANRNPKLQEDDEPDEWDKRIFSTGCAGALSPYLLDAAKPDGASTDKGVVDENAKMTDCYYDKKDWRACAAEMQEFRECWKRHGNNERTQSKDA